MASKPLPRTSLEAAPFWAGCAAGELRVQRCDACGARQLPPRARCLACAGTALGWQAVPPHGEVVSFTVVHRAPTPAFKPEVPYVVALVDLGERARLMVNVVDCAPGAVRIGTRVDIGFETRRDGEREMAIPVARLAGGAP